MYPRRHIFFENFFIFYFQKISTANILKFLHANCVITFQFELNNKHIVLSIQQFSIWLFGSFRHQQKTLYVNGGNVENCVVNTHSTYKNTWILKYVAQLFLIKFE